MAHDHHSAGEEDGLRDRVRDEDDGRTGLLPDPQHLGVHPLAGHLVEGAERLVHEQEGRLQGERAGDRDALLHATGELVGVVTCEVGELHQPQHLAGSFLALGAAHAEQLQRQPNVVLDAPPVEEDGSLEDDAVLPAAPRLGGRLAVDHDLPRRRLGQVTDDPEQRALAAAGRPDEGHELAAIDLEVDPGERSGQHLIPGGEDFLHALEANDRTLLGGRCCHVVSGPEPCGAHSARRSGRGCTTRSRAGPRSGSWPTASPGR